MRVLILVLAFLLGGLPLKARSRAYGFCEEGGQVVVTSSVSSTTRVQRSYPTCTVTVYAAGTLNLSTIFSDDAGTSKGNPFSADSRGYWFFYADNGRYDVKLSGGGIPAPFTLGDVVLSDPAAILTPPLTVGQGGTGATTAAGARTNLGAAASGANSDITSLTGLTTPLSVPQGGTGAATLTGVVVGTGTPALTGLAAASQLQALRRKANQTSTTYEFANPPVSVSADYDFPAQSPGGSLSVGANTVTLTPCPLGVAGSNTSHNLYISGGVGAAEAVPITGGTCTSGAASGTVIITAANTHSGAWTIASASAGILEAAWACGTNCEIYIPADNYTLRGTVTLPAAKNIRVRGAGHFAGCIDPQFATGHAFTATPTNGVVQFSDLCIDGSVSRTSGALIHVKAAFGKVERNFVRGNTAYNGIHVENCSDCVVVGNDVRQTTNYGIFIQATAGGSAVAGVYAGNFLAANAGSTGIRLEASAANAVTGPILTHNVFQGGAINLDIIPNGGQTNEGRIVGNVLDSATTFGIRLGNSTGTGFGWTIADNLIGTVGTSSCIYLYSQFSTVSISNNICGPAGNSQGVVVLGAKNINVQGNQVLGAGNLGAGDISLQITVDGAAVAKGIRVSGNSLGRNSVHSSCTANTGLTVSADAHEDIQISDNYLCGTAADLSFNATSTGHLILRNRYGNTGGAKPACDATMGPRIRGSLWYTQSGVGVADLYEVCRKSSADTYAWTGLF